MLNVWGINSAVTCHETQSRHLFNFPEQAVTVIQELVRVPEMKRGHLSVSWRLLPGCWRRGNDPTCAGTACWERAEAQAARFGLRQAAFCKNSHVDFIAA